MDRPDSARPEAQRHSNVQRVTVADLEGGARQRDDSPVWVLLLEEGQGKRAAHGHEGHLLPLPLLLQDQATLCGRAQTEG